MKVILLSPLPPPSGGIAGWTQRMLAANLKNGWTVDVVDEKLIGDRNEKGGGYRKSMLTEFQRSRHIWGDLKRKLQDADVKVVQACIPATTGAMLREIVSAKITHRHGRKFITHFRCTVPNMVKSKHQMRLLKKLIKNSDSVFCLNQQTIDYLHELNNKANCVYIPNFVDNNEVYEKEEYTAEIKKIVYTGRIFENKGCRLMINVAKECPDIQFELIGKVMMDVSDAPKNVIFTGEKNKEFIRQELKNADVFMFLTSFPGEGFSNSLAEAMAYSLPCIVTDWAANSDMIGVDGGIIVNNPTADNVISAIKFMYPKVVREEMGIRNYKTVQKKYSQQRVTGLYVDHYENLIQNDM